LTGLREHALLETVGILLDARRTQTPIADLTGPHLPLDMEEVYFVQDAVAAAYGPVGGFKIGAPSLEATPVFAPMPLAWIAASGAVISSHRYRGLEAEIAFLVGEDLPPRLVSRGEAPYTRAEVLAAMASCHPAIEVLESAFLDPTTASRFASLADLQMHGGFIYGPAFQGPGGSKDAWQNFDFNTDAVVLSVDSVVRVERTGSNTSGDLLRLLPFLANEGAARTGGLRKGQWITTGSWTGNTLANMDSRVDVDFTHAGHVDLRFA
jgi:2-keto-4-pentenoate hydratase